MSRIAWKGATTNRDKSSFDGVWTISEIKRSSECSRNVALEFRPQGLNGFPFDSRNL